MSQSQDPLNASQTVPSDSPWYRDGLKFTCSGCGDCCTGAPGYVWINAEEIAQLARRQQLSIDDFEEQYTRKIGIRRSLKEFPNGSCVFFDEEKRHCQVYEDRPRQCRSWPFWNSNLRSPEAWAQTCGICPGSGQGKLHQLEHIETQRSLINI